MALFPLHSNFQGDFVVQLVAVDSENTMEEVAQACAYHSEGRRVRKQPRKLRVRKHQTTELFPTDMTVAESGLEPTEVIDVIYHRE